MIIKINTKTEIMWIVVALYLLKIYVLRAELFFLFCGFVIVLYTIRKKAISIPKIPGLIFYVLMLILATIVGMTKYPISLIERDIFYEFFSVMYLFIGYYTYDYYKGRDKSLWKTACLVLFIVSTVCVVQGISSVTAGADFTIFREQFGQSICSISFMLPVLIGKRYIYKENTFSPFRDNFIIALWLLQILLNLSRISIVNVLIGMTVFIICGIYTRRLNLYNSFRITSIILAIAIVSITFFNMMPDDAKDRFTDKFSKSLTEISSENEYDDISSAQSDWRGYEINCAQKQWNESDILTQLIGAGNGTFIFIEYIPDQWKETVEIQNGRFGVTILHNTYYTLLVKGGLLTLIALLALIFLNIVKGFRALSTNNKETLLYATALIIFEIQIIVDAYVIRNMMDRGSEMIALLLIGWINAKLNNTEGNSGYINEKI